MDDFYAKIVLNTVEKIDNTDDLMLSLDTIEFQLPELLRLDFVKTKVFFKKNEDGTCQIEVYGLNFDYNTYKADYEKLSLVPEDFTYNYFDSIFNGSFKVTEILVECTDRKDVNRLIPLELEKIQLVFSTEIGESIIDFSSKVTGYCLEKLNCCEEPDLIKLAGFISRNEEYSGFCEAFTKAFVESISTDNEKLEWKGRCALKSIQDNSIDDLLISVCGWSLESLMKKAYIIPDRDSRFHKEIIDATFVSIWDDDVRKETACKINTKTREIFDIEHKFDKDDEELFECYSEYVSIDGIDFPAVPEDAYKSGQKLSFWYGENE